MPTGAWGSKTSNAIRAPPPQTAGGPGGRGNNDRGRRPRNAGTNYNNSNNNNNNSNYNNYNNNNNNNGGRGGGGRKHRGNRSNNNNNYNNNGPQNKQNNDGNNKQQYNGGNNRKRNKGANLEFMKSVRLLVKGDGDAKIRRYTAQQVLALRLNFLNPSGDANAFIDNIPPACRWDTEKEPNREQFIRSNHHVANESIGEVSKQHPKKNVVETAPPLEECVPLSVNEETRWKSKVMVGADSDQQQQQQENNNDDEETILKLALSILNKLSPTKFDKLCTDFVNTGIGKHVHLLTQVIDMIVQKAQTEPHFASMYARLCAALSNTIVMDSAPTDKKKVTFKKILLTRCQEAFDAEKLQAKMKAIEEKHADEPEERAYHLNLVRKSYVSHMKFIGELYKVEMIKLSIMLFCLQNLLGLADNQGDNDDNATVDEDNLECFAQLMSTIGSSLEKQAKAYRETNKKNEPTIKLQECWNLVHDLCSSNPPKLSNRMRFMLLDLIELRQNDWVTRRKTETAKTLDQIKNDVAKEEAAAAMQRRSSSQRIRRTASQGSAQISSDGFVQVVSNSRLSRATSDGGIYHHHQQYLAASSAPSAKARRTNSFTTAPPPVPPPPPRVVPPPPPPPAAKDNLVPLKDLGDKSKNLFQEYFVGGDTADALLSVKELIGPSSLESQSRIERGAEVLGGGIMFVLERRQEDSRKFMKVITEVYKEDSALLERDAVCKSLQDPLEFLMDIEIDAPLAGWILAFIVARWMSDEMPILKFQDLVTASPDMFKTDGEPAKFACKVLAHLLSDGKPTEEQMEIVQQLMTEKDKADFKSSTEMYESIASNKK